MLQPVLNVNITPNRKNQSFGYLMSPEQVIKYNFVKKNAPFWSSNWQKVMMSQPMDNLSSASDLRDRYMNIVLNKADLMIQNRKNHPVLLSLVDKIVKGTYTLSISTKKFFNSNNKHLTTSKTAV